MLVSRNKPRLSASHLLWSILSLCSLLVTAAVASAADFSGKTISVIVPSSAGGGTDLLARLLSSYYSTNLAGEPTIVVRNMPGASGLVAYNYFAQQGNSSGLTIMVGTPIGIDPLSFRRPQSHYDPAKFEFIGGFSLGGGALIIRKDAEKRLYDSTLPAVTMGTLGGQPRTNAQMAAWAIKYFDWNAKWVSGYVGSEDLVIALQRGEVDMTVMDSLFLIQKLLDGHQFKAILQSGLLDNGQVVGRPALSSVPLISEKIADKLGTSEAKQAFTYWLNLRTLEKWIAAPPDTKMELLQAYRGAFAKASKDETFTTSAAKLSDSLSPISHQEVTKRVRSLSETPSNVINSVFEMLRKQGVGVAPK